jgi:hypothetical protein
MDGSSRVSLFGFKWPFDVDCPFRPSCRNIPFRDNFLKKFIIFRLFERHSPGMSVSCSRISWTNWECPLRIIYHIRRMVSVTSHEG